MSSPPRFEAKPLYRRLDRLFGAVDPGRPQGQLLESFLEEFFAELHADLRLRGASLYEERRDDFALLRHVGDVPEPVDTLAPGSPPLQLLFRHRVYVFAEAEAEASPYRFGVTPRGAAAALVLGRRGRRHVFFFSLGEGWVMEELDFALNTVRAALGSRLLDARVRDSFQQAAEIQQSLLEEPPDFPGFEIACRSLATEEVGGDFFDFLPFDSELLGLAIGDASGHGMPAALLVRDVVTGLRMGIERELKVTHVFRKLNRVIHRSNLSSRFVSVFYGELEPSGLLIYVNAGHQPPLVFDEEGVHELATGGTVIGPLPEADFKRGFARLAPGAILVMCTDGILERRNPAGEFFGEEGLKSAVRAAAAQPAEAILDRVFEAARAHGDARPFEDDATLVVVKRLATTNQA
ncbi:MAG TPA: PP2C family protein-serine/threonine phosphatase [Vicinamibacteria bacterium]|nr:PP2C family protein-serine/threonine phosphatase [Vicinamibacteria bacterium]